MSNAGEHVEKLDYSHTAGGNGKCYSLWKAVCDIPKNLSMQIGKGCISSLSISLTSASELKIISSKKTYLQILDSCFHQLSPSYGEQSGWDKWETAGLRAGIELTCGTHAQWGLHTSSHLACQAVYDLTSNLPFPCPVPQWLFPEALLAAFLGLGSSACWAPPRQISYLKLKIALFPQRLCDTFLFFQFRDIYLVHRVKCVILKLGLCLQSSPPSASVTTAENIALRPGPEASPTWPLSGLLAWHLPSTLLVLFLLLSLIPFRAHLFLPPAQMLFVPWMFPLLALKLLV